MSNRPRRRRLGNNGPHLCTVHAMRPENYQVYSTECVQTECSLWINGKIYETDDNERETGGMNQQRQQYHEPRASRPRYNFSNKILQAASRATWLPFVLTLAPI